MDTMPYKVVLDCGLSGRTVDLPDAGSFEGDKHAIFPQDKVAGIIYE